MAFTPYTAPTSIIGTLGTNPSQRGLTTQEFKDKFDQFGTEFTAWFNAVHRPELDALPVEAVPPGRTVNGQPLTADVALGPADVGIPRVNLLDNWDFLSPVNQRGQSVYSGAGYTIDRWYIGADGTGSAALSAGGLTLTKTGGTSLDLRQKLEQGARLAGKTVTLSVETAGSIFSGSGTLDGGFSFMAGTAGLQALVAAEGGVSVVTLRVPDTEPVTVSRVKLELGSGSTLAYDPTADAAAQLAACRRYYQTGVSMAAAYNTTVLACNTPLSKMRAAPTVKIFSYQNTADKVSSWSNLSDVGANAAFSAGGSECILSISDSSAPFAPGSYYVFRYGASADL